MMARTVRKEDLAPFEPDEATPLDVYTPVHGNILAMMAESGTHLPNGARGRGESIQNDQAVAAGLPLEHSAVDETGHMDHHRKPIISIHGKDVDEDELEHKGAA
jgi:hypothetical protein